jgi:hypothetical protein
MHQVSRDDECGKFSVIARSLRRGNPAAALANSFDARMTTAAGLPRFARNDRLGLAIPG